MLEFNEETHEYKVDGIVIPSVTQILRDEGFIDSTWYDEHSRTRGRYVHKATALWDRNALDLDTLDPVIKPYLAGWVSFLKDSGFKIRYIEPQLGPGGFGFAGTPDRVGMLNEHLTIPDLKTGKPEPWTALQLSGYEILWGVSVKRIAVQLTVEGKYKVFSYTDRNDRQIFMAVLAVHNWKRNHRA